MYYPGPNRIGMFLEWKSPYVLTAGLSVLRWSQLRMEPQSLCGWFLPTLLPKSPSQSCLGVDHLSSIIVVSFIESVRSRENALAISGPLSRLDLELNLNGMVIIIVVPLWGTGRLSLHLLPY
jgi:hypothetical protein